MKRKSALTALQIAVTLAILYFVFRDPNKRAEMVAALTRANPFWLVLGATVYGIVEILGTVRWQILLRVQGIVLSWSRVFALVMIGLVFNFFIPGGTGGDVVKIFYLLKETPGQRTAAVLSVFVDRIIGLIGLIALAAFLTVKHWSWLMSTAETAQYVWLVFLILGASVAGLAFSFVVTGFGLVHRLPAKMPGRDKLAELALAYNLYGRAWRPSLAAFALSIVVHLGSILTFFYAAKAYASPDTRIPTASEFFTVAPIVNTLVSLPISLGGVGVREGLFQVFLGNLCEVNEAVAVVISSTGYVLMLFWGLIGAGIYVFYRPSEHARLREMRKEVAAAEHSVAELEIEQEVAREKKHFPMKARPFVTANFAMTWDGRVSTRRFTPTNFTSKRDKHRLLEIRATADAVLVGVSTIVSDNMAMGMGDETLRAARIKRGQSPFPLRVLASNSGRIPKNLRVFTTGPAPIVIFSTTQMGPATRTRLARLADLWLYEGARVNLAAMLTTLRVDYGVRRVVCEGGPRLFRALLEEQLIDEIHLTLAPRIFGGTGAPTLTGLAGEFLPQSTTCMLRAMEIIDGECFLRYRVQHRRARVS